MNEEGGVHTLGLLLEEFLAGAGAAGGFGVGHCVFFFFVILFVEEVCG